MTKFVLPILLLCCVAASSRQPKAADYPLTVHVTRSHFAHVRNGWPSVQVIDVLINGKNLELFGENRSGLLMPGDYKAKLAKNIEKHGAFLNQTYVFLLPDKDTEPFWLYGESE